MKVLLVVPKSNCATRDCLELVSPPLGVAYVGSYIRQFGHHDVRIHDGLLLHSTDEKIIGVLEEFSPDVVGISGQATPAIYDVYHTARVVKKFDPRVLVVTGGAHVTFEDREALKECLEIDVVVRGEGEVTMKRLLEEYANNRDFVTVPGITFRHSSSLIRNQDAPFIENLDSLPFPAYDLLDLPRYFHAGHRFASMITSRGCPFQCIFCSSSRIVGKSWRGRTSDNVIREVQMLEDRYKVKDIVFLDDLFTFDYNRVYEICKALQGHGNNMVWSCSTRADSLARHPEMAGWLKSAGCHTIYIGAESGSQRVLEIIRKGTTLSQVVESVKTAKEAGLHVILSFVLGLPGETKDEVEATIDFAGKLDPDYAQFTICTPYPGTPLYEEASRNGWLNSHSWNKYSVLDPVMELPELPKDTLRRYLSKAYARFYLRPSFLWKLIKERNIYLFKKAIEAPIKYFGRIYH